VFDDGAGGPKPPTNGNIHDAETETIREAKYLLSVMMYYRKLCDDKASILLAIFGVVVTVILTLGGTSIAELFQSLTDNWWGYGLIAAVIVSALVLVFGIFMLIRTVNPETYTGWTNKKRVPILHRILKWIERKREIDHSSISIVYFKGVARLEFEKFKKTFRDMFPGKCNDTYLDGILDEVYITSEVCVRKYEQLFWGLFFSAIGIAAFALSLLTGFICV
jgi:hypothetical protein